MKTIFVFFRHYNQHYKTIMIQGKNAFNNATEVLKSELLETMKHMKFEVAILTNRKKIPF